MNPRLILLPGTDGTGALATDFVAACGDVKCADTARRFLADQGTRHAIFFQGFVEPIGRGAVAVAVAQEGPIARGDVRLPAAHAASAFTRK